MSFTDDLGKDWIEDAKQETGEVETVETEANQEEMPETLEEPENTEPESTEAEAQPEAKEKEAFDPVSHRKMMDERRKRQEAEAELIELRRQLSGQQKPEQTKQAPIPDAYEQPEEFGEYLRQQMEEQRFLTRLEVNGVRAETKYGEELVKQAVDWASSQNDPQLGFRMRQSASPVELVVQEYQQSRTLQAVAGRSLEDWAKDYATQQGWIVSPEQTAPSSKPSSSKAPPRSLASKPGSGGVGDKATGDAFEGVFSSTSLGLSKG